LTVTADVRLHVPDEPTARAGTWLAEVLDGNDLAAVLGGRDGVADWLWSRWSSLGAAGMTRDEFNGIVLGYRRELWLWLAGERTWVQACSGLVGRISRRMVQVDAAPA
jgi:hypothetical protein